MPLSYGERMGLIKFFNEGLGGKYLCRGVELPSIRGIQFEVYKNNELIFSSDHFTVSNPKDMQTMMGMFELFHNSNSALNYCAENYESDEYHSPSPDRLVFRLVKELPENQNTGQFLESVWIPLNSEE